MIRHLRLLGVVLGSACLLALLAAEAGADAKKGKGKPAAAKGKGKGKGKGGAGQTGNAFGDAVRDLQEARIWLAEGKPIYDGHRGRAMNYVESAIGELLQANAGGSGKGKPAGKGKGKAAAKGKAGGTTPIVKLKNNNNLPAGWEVSNGQLQQAATLVQSAIGKMKGNDPHAQAASAYAQLALQEINTALTFVNNLAGNAGATKKKGR